jgi:hypothetical protein
MSSAIATSSSCTPADVDGAFTNRNGQSKVDDSDYAWHMSDLLLFVLLIAALLALDILALEFGADSRKLHDPSRLPWPGF